MEQNCLWGKTFCGRKVSEVSEIYAVNENRPMRRCEVWAGGKGLWSMVSCIAIQSTCWRLVCDSVLPSTLAVPDECPWSMGLTATCMKKLRFGVEKWGEVLSTWPTRLYEMIFTAGHEQDFLVLSLQLGSHDSLESFVFNFSPSDAYVFLTPFNNLITGVYIFLWLITHYSSN